MNNCFRCAFYSLKGLADNMLSGLCQHLDSNILRDQIAIDQGAKKCIFCLRCSWKTNFNFFESNLYKELEKLNLLFQTHWNYKRLVAITKIY